MNGTIRSDDLSDDPLSASNEHAPTWQQLGFGLEFLDAVAQNEKTALDLWWSGPPSSSDDVESWASSAISDGTAVFVMGCMGYVIRDSPLSDWRGVGRRVVSAAVYYFHGKWRDKFKWLLQEYDRRTARTELPWSDAYREGLALALALGDWTSADRLLAWPGPDLQWDEGTDDRIREDNAYQIWLASRLRGEPEGHAASQRELAQREQKRECKAALGAAKALCKVQTLLPGTEAIANAVLQREMIQGGSRRRPKMLLAAADALLAGNGDELATAMTAYLRHYRQRELRPNRPDFGVCLDVTALWHLAQHRGLGEIALPEDVMILIARP